MRISGRCRRTQVVRKTSHFPFQGPQEAQPEGLRLWTWWLPYLLGLSSEAVEVGKWEAPASMPGVTWWLGMLESAGILWFSLQLHGKGHACLLLTGRLAGCGSLCSQA